MHIGIAALTDHHVSGGTCDVSQHSPMADLDPAVHLAGPRLLARLLRVVVWQQEADVEEQEQEHGGREAQGCHHQPLLQLHGEWCGAGARPLHMCGVSPSLSPRHGMSPPSVQLQHSQPAVGDENLGI